MTELAPPSSTLVEDLRVLIENSRQRVAVTVNRALVVLYWRAGRRISLELLADERAEYGKQIVSTLSAQLVPDFGRGFSRRNIYRMIQFSKAFPDEHIVTTLSAQLSWSHFVELLLINDHLERDFYAEMSRREGWSVRTLRARTASMLFARTALSKQPAETIRDELQALHQDDTMTPDLVFRDPYLLDFLRLNHTWSERDLEAAILRELESFLLELGTDFCFVARQKRIIVDGDDHYIDLLFFHRSLNRLVLIELKLGRFRAADKGQVELYLRWLDRHERRANEEAPLALILCASKGQQLVELLDLEASGIRVAEYITELPARELLERKLLQAMEAARTSAGRASSLDDHIE